jgi:hypothetical protein
MNEKQNMKSKIKVCLEYRAPSYQDSGEALPYRVLSIVGAVSLPFGSQKVHAGEYMSDKQAEELAGRVGMEVTAIPYNSRSSKI